jgi:hypothetical protein
MGPAVHRSDKPPSLAPDPLRLKVAFPARGVPRSAAATQAPSSCHTPKGERNPDPSRGLEPAVGDSGAGDPDDRAAPPRFADDGGWPHGVVGGGISGGKADCNTAVRDHNDSRDKRPYGKWGNDKSVDGIQSGRGGASVSRGGTGQPAPIMAGYSHCWLEVLDRAANKKPRLLQQPGFPVPVLGD